jgi:hypothetical protein
MPSYVNIEGIPTNLLELLGYLLVKEDAEFMYFSHKGDEYVIDKAGRQLLYVEDDNDAAILRNGSHYPVPPKDGGTEH